MKVQRVLDITKGTAMIVTDLHGDREVFDRYVRRFRELHKAGDVQRLILLGDLIHGYGPPEQDGSLRMVLDLMALQAEYGANTVTMLLGNHEMPHIYGVSLFKGNLMFTPRFEHSMGQYRAQIIDFFERLPFFVRTAAGVLLGHAGPAAEVIGKVDALCAYDHRAILERADRVLAEADDLDLLYRHYGQVHNVRYDEAAREMLAVSGPDDPRYPHLLRGFMIAQQDEAFALLWDALFTQNESGMSPLVYGEMTKSYLRAWSMSAPLPVWYRGKAVPQRVMVSGHIVTPAGGQELVNRQHLRISSAAHARPREAGVYLLLDCSKPVRSALDLASGLGSVFHD